MNPLRKKSWSPYVVGIGIGVLSWAAFATANRPLGITTAFEHTAALAENAVVPSQVSAYYDAQAKAFVDRLSAPILEFAIDASGKRVVFRDGSTLEGANFNVVHALIGNYRKAKAEVREVPFFPSSSLAAGLKIDEQSLRQQLSRLRKAIEPLNVSLGVPLGNDTFIETKERAGYRLNPELRELSLSDIRVTNPILPHA